MSIWFLLYVNFLIPISGSILVNFLSSNLSLQFLCPSYRRMRLHPSSFLHTGHIPWSTFPLVPFSVQMPLFHLPILRLFSPQICRLLRHFLFPDYFLIHCTTVASFIPHIFFHFSKLSPLYSLQHMDPPRPIWTQEIDSVFSQQIFT
jgi:hypothetical protein